MPVSPLATAVACPELDCPTLFTCDGCLDEHLRSVHGTSYTAVYGKVLPDWLVFCEGHGNFPVGRLAATR